MPSKLLKRVALTILIITMQKCQLRNDSDSLVIWSAEDEREYQDTLNAYQKTVDYIKQYTEYDILTLEALEERLAKQLQKNSD